MTTQDHTSLDDLEWGDDLLLDETGDAEVADLSHTWGADNADPEGEGDD